jgi:D-threo-aldose 1-dehydrogenase
MAQPSSTPTTTYGTWTSGRSPSTAAISFSLAHPDIINGTLGMRNRQQVGRNEELHRQHLRNELRAQGLIRSDLPAANGPGRSARCL